MRVLIACEFSGVVRDAFAAKGHDAWSCDLLPSEAPGKHYQEDIRRVVALWAERDGAERCQACDPENMGYECSGDHE